MNKESKDFLVKLLSQCGPSGFEEAPQDIWVKRSRKFADKTYKDVHGNAFAVLNPDADFRVMLAGHCDEIGFIITHVSKEGCLHIVPIGGIDAAVLPGSHVKVMSQKGLVDGVIGKKAIHLTHPNEREKVIGIKDLWVDIGAKDRKDALKIVDIGDPVTFAPNYMELKNNCFSSKAADNRAGSFVVAEVIKLLSEKKSRLKASVYAVSTVQEEVGLRGAATSAYGINPHIGIGVDVGFASDTPGIDKRIVGEVSLGKGPVLHAGPAINRILGQLFRDTAKKKKIPYQFSSLGRPDGTDTSALQVSRQGVATALISVPNRYMHTQVETCCVDDLGHAARLIAETILSMKPTMNFIP